jgi:hypothetical protein
MSTSDAVLSQILARLDALQVSQQTLQAKVGTFNMISNGVGNETDNY